MEPSPLRHGDIYPLDTNLSIAHLQWSRRLSATVIRGPLPRHHHRLRPSMEPSPLSDGDRCCPLYMGSRASVVHGVEGGVPSMEPSPLSDGDTDSFPVDARDARSL